MREFYENQLEELHSALITMGNTCQKSIENTSEALILNDKKLASKVMKQSTKISQQERDIEGKCMNLLLLQQPMAGDFRQVSAALKIITDMERIGIQAGDIAEILLTDDVGLEASKIPLQKMADEYTSYYGEEYTAKDIEKLFGEQIMRYSFIETLVSETLVERISDMPEIPQKTSSES